MKWIVNDGSGKLRWDAEELRAVTAVEDASTIANPWGGARLERGAVHELLFDPKEGAFSPGYLALRVAAAAVKGFNKETGTPAKRSTTARMVGQVVWCDPYRLVYPPALEEFGLERVCVLRPSKKDVVWATAECLACAGVSVVIASLPARLTRVEARRLQLAAERGGDAGKAGVGVFLRSREAGSEVYAASTRWLVSPAPPMGLEGREGTQAWRIEMVHGHGRSGQCFHLERRRAIPAGFAEALGESVSVYSAAPLADRSAVAARLRLGA